VMISIQVQLVASNDRCTAAKFEATNFRSRTILHSTVITSSSSVHSHDAEGPPFVMTLTL
jgi:hypothetical protein